MGTYWFDPAIWNLIRDVQQVKREELDPQGRAALRSDMSVMVNPVTGKTPSQRDLRYARTHLRELIDSGRIKESRWAFLWYH